MKKLKALPQWLQVIGATMISGALIADILKLILNYEFKQGLESNFMVLFIAIIWVFIIYKPFKRK